MSIKKYTEEELKKLKDETDYERVNNMTDEEIEENSQTDEDAKSPTDEQLKKFKKVMDKTKWKEVISQSDEITTKKARLDPGAPILNKKVTRGQERKSLTRHCNRFPCCARSLVNAAFEPFRLDLKHV